MSAPLAWWYVPRRRFGSLGDAAPGVTREALFERFMTVTVPHVWEPATVRYIAPHITLGVYEPLMFGKHKPLAAVVLGSRPRAFFYERTSGEASIHRRAEWYKLVIADRLLQLDMGSIDKVLVHEAVHLGFSNHGKDFMRLCAARGGSPSEYAVDAAENEKVILQERIGARFVTIGKFATEAEATVFAQKRLDVARAQLEVYLNENEYLLCPDCKQRHARVFHCKVEGCKRVLRVAERAGLNPKYRWLN